MNRKIDGFLVVDKPPEMTSAKLTAIVKRLLGAKKVGHTGTLDPFATGVMLMCLGKATKLARFFLHAIKTYKAILHLGIETDTQDLTGQITATNDPWYISENNITGVFENFRGTIRQVPPIFSALKHHGEPLYKLARMGKPFQKPPRTVHIYDLEILDIRIPEIEFKVTCSGGTYIRTLVADMGKALGCGGYLKVLSRIRSAGFKIEESVSLEELKILSESGAFDTTQQAQDFLIPMTKALKHMDQYVVEEDKAEDIMNGSKVFLRDLSEKVKTGEKSAEKHFRQQTDDHYIKVINRRGNLIAVLYFEKNQNIYKYCCVFPN